MLKCEHCGTESPDDAKFCHFCGQPLPQAEEAGAEVVESEPVVEVEPEVAAEADSAAEAEPVVVVEPELEADPVAEQPAAPEPETEPVAAVESEPEPEPEVESAAEHEARVQAAVKAHEERVAAAAAAVAAAAASTNTSTSTASSSYTANAANGASATPRTENTTRATTIPPTKTDGYISRAWRDVSQSPGWAAKSLLLALIMLVPILDFVAFGYILRWGRTAAYRDGDDLPPVAITGDYFKLGFFAALISLCWSVAFALVGSIPLIGVLMVVVAIFAAPAISLCVFRTNLLNSLPAAFDLKKVWGAYKRDVGGLMAIEWLPALICVGICLVIGLAFTLILGVGALAGAAAYSVGFGDAFFATFGMGLGLLIMIACAFIINIVGAAVQMVIFRAFGYWIRDHADEWLDEARAAAYGSYQ